MKKTISSFTCDMCNQEFNLDTPLDIDFEIEVIMCDDCGQVLIEMGIPTAEDEDDTPVAPI